ncbi:MFS transporter [Jeotgalibacillus proteolyticus]|uniref:MFS transporter n=1 Tax=Jeotgalibacillus proteolyticus TaxID=2082395 RepID=A0A2S5GBL2_9BACL|nr:MFS transporter [Jeotgalibacillus proteolyticus]PPA70305.1 MFS transporter [Jeotgalibacillus proteolyticus]
MNNAILPDSRYHSRLGWQMLGWLLMAQILVALVGRGVAPLSPLIAEDLTLTNAQVGLLPSALFAGQMLVSIPSGLLVDKMGTKKLLFIVCLLLGLSYSAASLFSSYFVILLCIVIGGMAYGTMHPVTNRGILYWFPQRQRGTAMGIKQMGITLGSALAAAALLPLAAVWGWRPALLAACLVLIGAGALSYLNYKENPLQKKESVSEPASILHQIMEVAKSRSLVLISIVAFIINGSQMSLNVYILFYVGNELLFGLGIAGTMFVLSEAGGSFGRIVWGTVSDKFFGGRRAPVMFILTLMAFAGSLSMLLLTPETPVWVLAVVIFLLGFAVSGFNGLWMNIATELTPPQTAGLASGFSLTIGSMGVIIIPPVFGWIADLNQSFTASWMFMAAVMAAAVFFLGLLRRRRSF